MSQEDNQGISPPQERSSLAVPGDVGDVGVETSEGSHRISINDPSSSIDHSRTNPKLPTSPTSMPKLRQRKSNYNDDDDEEYDSEDSIMRKRRELRRRHSYRRR